MFFYDYLGKSDLKDITGTVDIQVSLPTEYSVVKITKNDVGKTIDIGENQKIKLQEFVDNKVHFEVIGNEKLRTEVTFSNLSANVKSYYTPKFLYQFFCLNSEMKYKEFEKNYKKFLEKEETDLEKNKVYVYTLYGKPDAVFFYHKKEETMLKKDLKLEIRN